jgi:hypothetical protein
VYSFKTGEITLQHTKIALSSAPGAARAAASLELHALQRRAATRQPANPNAIWGSGRESSAAAC